MNSGGNSGWTAPINAVTTGGGNYLLTAGFLPTAGVHVAGERPPASA